MPIRTPSPRRCFMVDFASRDSRSAHAHLRGANPRAQAYIAFEFVERCLGRRQEAPDDFRNLAGWAHRHRGTFLRIKTGVIDCLVAVMGLSAGAALACLFLA